MRRTYGLVNDPVREMTQINNGSHFLSYKTPSGIEVHQAYYVERDSKIFM